MDLQLRVSAPLTGSGLPVISELHPGDSAWQTARDALTTGPDAVGRVVSK